MVCFILTVWNVKLAEPTLESTPVARFILTVWNVKIANAIFNAIPNKCFILTVWNVKGRTILDKVFGWCVLY